MPARGPLMIEHRLIERLIAIVRQTIRRLEAEEKVDPEFVDAIVDFIRTYADRTHHGKEEDLLFRDLEEKDLSPGDRRVAEELIAEHVFGRQITKELVEANSRYRHGDPSALNVIKDKLRLLADFYPRHIEKEDKRFFPACQAYFSEAEEQSRLQKFWEFDRKMIHEKYGKLVQELEAKIA